MVRDLSIVDINDLKKEIYTLYEALCVSKNIKSSDIMKEEFPRQTEDSSEYIYHSYKLVRTGNNYEIYDTAKEKIIDSYYPEGYDDSEIAQVVTTDYPVVRNKFCLFLIAEYLRKEMSQELKE